MKTIFPAGTDPQTPQEMLDVIDFVAAVIFVFLFFTRIQQALSGDLSVLILAVQAGLTSILLVIRKPARQRSKWQLALVAWLSAFAPLTMITSSSWSTPAFSLPGLMINIWALLALGDRFSIAPIDCGVICRGPYRRLRHPMYAGELLSLLGVCFANPLAWNWLVLAVFTFAVFKRIAGEEQLLGGDYCKYAAAVCWRLIPGVW